MDELPIESFRLQNFKAVRDSGEVKFTPLTVFIGNNGSGKSSLIEGLEMLHLIVTEGLDRAMQQWRGFEHIWNQTIPHEIIGISTPLEQPTDEANPPDTDELPPDSDPSLYAHSDENNNVENDPNVESSVGFPYLSNPMTFTLQTQERKKVYKATIEITMTPSGDKVFIKREKIEEENVYLDGTAVIERDAQNKVITKFADGQTMPDTAPDDYLYLNAPGTNYSLEEFISSWQFLVLNPQTMGSLKLQKRTGGEVKLERDGSNIAEYLLSFRKLEDGQEILDGIVETLRYVLPYADDLQPSLTSELERNVYLQLKEGDYKIPGWLLSTGTLRILAILAVLRHPEPPPVLVIEELENGLDPRTIQRVVEEIRSSIEEGRTQVIVTTHSPYLLDLLDLSQIVVVERSGGQPIFTRPGNQANLQKWSQEFAPGQLYIKGLLDQAR